MSLSLYLVDQLVTHLFDTQYSVGMHIYSLSWSLRNIILFIFKLPLAVALRRNKYIISSKPATQTKLSKDSGWRNRVASTKTVRSFVCFEPATPSWSPLCLYKTENQNNSIKHKINPYVKKLTHNLYLSNPSQHFSRLTLFNRTSSNPPHFIRFVCSSLSQFSY